VNLNVESEFMQQHLQRTIGVICLAIGIILLVHGHKIAHSPDAQVRRFLPIAPSDRSTYFYIAGAALAIFGASQIVWPAKPK
jgi:Protein of unknown function (DUF3185)